MLSLEMMLLKRKEPLICKMFEIVDAIRDPVRRKPGKLLPTRGLTRFQKSATTHISQVLFASSPTVAPTTAHFLPVSSSVYPQHQLARNILHS